MNRRTFLKIGIMAGIGMLLPRSVLGQTPPPPGLNNLPHILKNRVKVADRMAAIENAKKMGLLPGAAAGAVTNIDGVPHYFGPYPNYANSPMPKGSIVDIVVDAGGSGYTLPPVVSILDVYGTGSGASATANLVGGVVDSITVNFPGSGYSAPKVVIENAPGDVTGAGAAASTVIGGILTGGIRKFVDSLAGLDPNTPNSLGQFIPVAVADTTSFPGSDYYEIELGDFTQQFHTDLPPTKLRGYRQVNAPDLPGGIPNPVNEFHYLGPLIVAQRDIPVRIKFINSLPTGAGGDLFIPVDETVMGAGEGPLDVIGQPGVKEKYTHNRATLHLHGGLTPWISDGTPHQWITPAGEQTQYPKGVSVVNVPDMPDPGEGAMTFYYTNEQSARLMFYHDHAYGITRLNVYAGEAAGYLLTDEVEQDLINGSNNSGVNLDPPISVLPDIGIPLIIQDKTFVDATTIFAQDPTWRWGLDTNGNPVTGSLWLPSVYMPAQNPWDPSGASAFGRWQYGPWFWPPTENIAFGPVPNEYYDPINAPWEPPMRPMMPNPSMGMEAFNDTMMVNGTIYPYLELEPKTYRFRVLNAANDRFVNLQFYLADPDVVTSDGRTDTEVRMVPAIDTPGFPPTWPIDARAGGVPDPSMAGPSWIQIGTEGGFLPEPVVIPPQPIAWNMNATAFNVGNVTDHSLLLGCAERADVLVDFTPYAGRTLILYNDAPAAFPALDPRYDYYTGNPDQTDSGGTPTTHAGYGPNIRTIMQVRIKGPAAGASIASVTVTNGGADYENAPEVVFTGGGGTGADAVASGKLDHITVRSGGAGYTSAPTVTLSAPEEVGGVQATATAVISNGRVIRFNITNPGSGYTVAPTVTLTGGGFTTAATAVSALIITAIRVVSGGTGYTSLPSVSLVGGGGYGAAAVAVFAVTGTPYDMAALMNVWKKNGTKRGVFEVSQDPIIIPQAAYNSAYEALYPADNTGYVQLHDFNKTIFGGPKLSNGELFNLVIKAGGSGYTNPTITISAPPAGGTAATGSVTATGGVITGVTLDTPGSGYTAPPTITVNGGGTGAVIVANELPIEPKAIHDEMGAAYDVEFGRMGGLLGLELPKVNSLNQNTTLLGYASPPVDILSNAMTPLGTLTDGTQIWKITQNGVDTHPMHFHIANVQVINRVAWDGALLPPDPNELGWKETVRTNPLEHLIVAMRPYAPNLPFDVPNSIRPIDVTKPLGTTLMGGPGGFIDPLGTRVNVVNHNINFGWEFVWHCHILSHEEMDMMHALIFAMAPKTPTNLTATWLNGPRRAVLTWTNAAANATGFTIQRSTQNDFTTNLVTIKTAGVVTTYTDTTVQNNTPYYYRVMATNTVGDTVVYPAPSIGYPNHTSTSNWSNTASVNTPPVAPTLVSVLQNNPLVRTVTLTWVDNSNNETNFTVQRANASGGVVTGGWNNVTTSVPANATTYNDTTPQRGRQYAYRVLARNAAGSSAPSNVIFITTAA